MALYIGGFLIIFLTGFIKLWLWNSSLVKRHEFCLEYYNSFLEVCSKWSLRHQDASLGNKFLWLVKNGDKIQKDLGGIGIISYKYAGGRMFIDNYHLIINTMMLLQEGDFEEFNIHAVQNCLIRHMGSLEHELKNCRSQIVNPLVLFREGVKFLISTPVILLKEFGVISSDGLKAIVSSWLFRFVSGIVAFVSFFANLMTILLGKEELVSIWNKLLLFDVF